MAHGDFKDLKRKTQSDKVLKDKAFAIAKNPKYDGYQRGLASLSKRISFLTRNQKEIVLKMILSKINN